MTGNGFPGAGLPLVQARGLGRRYLGGGQVVEALLGVDLDLQAGESLAVTGASGSGKSTLLHILGCLDTPTSGSYRLDGREVALLGDAERSRIRSHAVGFVFQAFHLLPRRTVLDNVALPLLYRGVRRAPARRAALETLERVGLAARARHLPPELSGGERQRAAVARAVSGRPALLLADEPTGNLDSAGGRAIMDLLRGLNAAGTTLVVATHNLEVAARCARRLHLRDGAVAAGGAG